MLCYIKKVCADAREKIFAVVLAIFEIDRYVFLGQFRPARLQYGRRNRSCSPLLDTIDDVRLAPRRLLKAQCASNLRPIFDPGQNLTRSGLDDGKPDACRLRVRVGSMRLRHPAIESRVFFQQRCSGHNSIQGARCGCSYNRLIRHEFRVNFPTISVEISNFHKIQY